MIPHRKGFELFEKPSKNVVFSIILLTGVRFPVCSGRTAGRNLTKRDRNHLRKTCYLSVKTACRYLFSLKSSRHTDKKVYTDTQTHKQTDGYSINIYKLALGSRLPAKTNWNREAYDLLTCVKISASYLTRNSTHC